MDDQIESSSAQVITPDNPPTPNRQYAAAIEEPIQSRRGFLGRVLAPLSVVGAALIFGSRKEEPPPSAGTSAPESSAPNPLPTLTHPASGLEQHTIQGIATTKTGEEENIPITKDPQKLAQALQAARTTQYQSEATIDAENKQIESQIFGDNTLT